MLKQSASSELLEAIEAVIRGETYITPLLRQLGAGKSRQRGESHTGGPLNARQREVLQLVAEGKSAKDIAFQLGMSAKTVQFHKGNLRRRLGLHSTAELVRYAVGHGMTATI